MWWHKLIKFEVEEKKVIKYEKIIDKLNVFIYTNKYRNK